MTSGYFWPQKAFFVPLVDSEDAFAVSAVTGWISHLDLRLQRETNGPTSLYCLFNKRDKVTDNLSRPASKRPTNSEGTNKNQGKRRVSHSTPKFLKFNLNVIKLFFLKMKCLEMSKNNNVRKNDKYLIIAKKTLYMNYIS